MREIKFRIWDKRNKQWATDFLIDLDGGLVCDPPGTIFIRSDFEIMQYTGLKDVNGKEIYEGDFVMHKNSTVRELVSFNNGAFGTIQYKTFRSFDSQHESNCWNIKKWKVIGNIYDNPELLKLKHARD